MNTFLKLCQNVFMGTLKPSLPANSSQYCVISAPFGCLGVQTELVDGSLMISKVEYLPPHAKLSAPSNSLARLFARQCSQYFQNPAFKFDVPLKPVGTAHQQRVWNAISVIKDGDTKTYGEIAAIIKSGPRAVGTACGANPYPLITPCHRIVSVQGIGGFMREDQPGVYRQIKIWLLKHESVI